MSDFSRRNAVLCGLVGLGFGILIGGNLGGLLWPFAQGIDVGRPWPYWNVTFTWAPIAIAALLALFWVAVWLMLIRGLFWGGPWGRRGRFYHGRLEDLPADFDDWHRRAHERMKEAPSADDPGRRG